LPSAFVNKNAIVANGAQVAGHELAYLMTWQQV